MFRTEVAEYVNLFRRQVVVLKDDFENRSPFGDFAIDLRNLGADILDVTGFQLANIDHHFDFVRAGIDCRCGFESFDGGRGATVWKADHGADLDGSAAEKGDGERDVVGFDAYGCNGIFFAEGDLVGAIGVGKGGVEKGVVYHLGEVVEGDLEFWHDGEIWGFYNGFLGSTWILDEFLSEAPWIMNDSLEHNEVCYQQCPSFTVRWKPHK